MIEPTQHDRDKLEALLVDLLDQGLSAERLGELGAILNREDEAIDYYVESLMMHAMLKRSMDYTSPTGLAPAPSPVNPPVVISTATSESSLLSENAATKGLFGGLGSAIHSYPLLFGIGLLFVTCIVALGVLLMRSRIVPDGFGLGGAIAGTESKDNDSNPASPAAVATITAGANCQWNGTDLGSGIGRNLSVGQSVSLLSGVAEVTFDIGARVTIQSPTSITVESPTSVRMRSGKLTAEITDTKAHGFKIITPDADFVDLGTEFGVEVAPGGSSRVHVFKGQVNLAITGKKENAVLPVQTLLANSGARLESDGSQLTYLQDTGESFMRSLDEANRDQHIVAYWRFEDHPVGTFVADTGGNKYGLRGTVDSSFNGNDLFTHMAGNRPSFSEDVPAEVIPQNGKVNRGCLDNTAPPDHVRTRDVYTHSTFSHASPIDVQQFSSRQWTIEVSAKVKALENRVQTFVGRDGEAPPGKAEPVLAFQINQQGHFGFWFVDISGRKHELVASTCDVGEERWYNLAAVSTGRELLLYVDAMDGRGYRMLAKKSLPDDDSTALVKGSDSAEWSIGRGKVDGNPAEWFRGWIDEVRISDIALDPSELLFAEKSKVQRTASVRDAENVGETSLQPSPTTLLGSSE